jgi:hypothetical protein
MAKTLKFFIAVLIISLSVKVGYPCTNFIVTKGASADGSVMITYTADSFNFYGELYHFPRLFILMVRGLKFMNGTQENILEKFRRQRLLIM